MVSLSHYFPLPLKIYNWICRHQGFGSFATEGAAFGSSSAATPNPHHAGGNPFGWSKKYCLLGLFLSRASICCTMYKHGLNFLSFVSQRETLIKRIERFMINHHSPVGSNTNICTCSCKLFIVIGKMKAKSAFGLVPLLFFRFSCIVLFL